MVQKGMENAARSCMFDGLPFACCLSMVSHDLLVAVFPVPARPYALGIGGVPLGTLRKEVTTFEGLIDQKGGYLAFFGDLGEVP